MIISIIETLKQQRTFDIYNDVDCIHYSGLHDYIKFLKFGYSKIHDHCSREIRLKRLTRKQSLFLIKKYIYSKPKDLNIFLKWLNISEKNFFECINKFRDKNIWSYQNGKWKLKDSVHLKHNFKINDFNFKLNLNKNTLERGFNYLKL